MSGIRGDQIDTVASEFEGAGTDSRQLSIKGGGVVEAKLGFSWVTVEVDAASFSYGDPRSTYTLATTASSNANVLDNAELLRNGIGGLTRVTTTSAAGEWSLDGTTLSIHGDVTAEGSTFQLRYVTGTASGPASASGNQIWLGTLPQQPLQTESDYFQGNELDSKWTEWDEPSTQTVTETSGEVQLLQTTTAGRTYTGIFQTAPADNQFCVTARIRFQALLEADGVVAGIMVAEDLVAAPSTANFVTSALVYDASTGVRWSNEGFTAYNGTINFTDLREVAEGVGYLRLFVDRTSGGSVQALYSLDGRTWFRINSLTWASASLSDVDSIGICLDNENTGDDAVLICDMFRVDITTDMNLPVGGYVGTSVPATFLMPRDVTVAPNSTLDLLGWVDRRVKLIKVEAFSTTVASVGVYTMAVTKDPNGTADNMLSTATFDMTTSGTLSVYEPGDVPLTSTADDLILDAGDVWEVSFVSDNAGLDAAGVYFQLTWLVL